MAAESSFAHVPESLNVLAEKTRELRRRAQELRARRQRRRESTEQLVSPDTLAASISALEVGRPTAQLSLSDDVDLLDIAPTEEEELACDGGLTLLSDVKIEREIQTDLEAEVARVVESEDWDSLLSTSDFTQFLHEKGFTKEEGPRYDYDYEVSSSSSLVHEASSVHTLPNNELFLSLEFVSQESKAWCSTEEKKVSASNNYRIGRYHVGEECLEVSYRSPGLPTSLLPLSEKVCAVGTAEGSLGMVDTRASTLYLMPSVPSPSRIILCSSLSSAGAHWLFTVNELGEVLFFDTRNKAASTSRSTIHCFIEEIGGTTQLFVKPSLLTSAFHDRTSSTLIVGTQDGRVLSVPLHSVGRGALASLNGSTLSSGLLFSASTDGINGAWSEGGVKAAVTIGGEFMWSTQSHVPSYVPLSTSEILCSTFSSLGKCGFMWTCGGDGFVRAMALQDEGVYEAFSSETAGKDMPMQRVFSMSSSAHASSVLLSGIDVGGNAVISRFSV